MKKKIIIGIFILLALLIVYYFLFINLGIGIECPIHELTGIYCPSCGITRLIFSLFELNIAKAFRYNQYIFILLCLSIVYLIIKYLFKIKISINNKYFYTIFIVSLIAWTIVRNIPYFTFLRP